MEDDLLLTIAAPKEVESTFLKAQEIAEEYFKDFNIDPTKGTINISGDRYFLLRTSTFINEYICSFHNNIKNDNNIRTTVRCILYDMAKALGRGDAKITIERDRIQNPLDRLAPGPIHFAYTGWSFVTLHENLVSSEQHDICLISDHNNSFESEVWIKAGIKSEGAACIMNCGYASGWCEVAFNTPLIAVEISCRARGDTNDRIIIAHPLKIEQHIEYYCNKYNISANTPFVLPDYAKHIKQKYINSEAIDGFPYIEMLANMERDLNNRNDEICKLKKEIKILKKL